MLGEEAVELWIGTIDPAVAAPHGSRPLAELPRLVAETVAEAMPNGEMGWSMLRADGPRGPVLVMCLNRLAPVQAPHHDEHVAVRVPFLDVTPDGWPGPGSLDRLRAFEDHLAELVRESGQLVAVETSGGVRTLHFYVDSTTPASAQLQVGTAGWDQGSITVSALNDPSWDAVKSFRE